MSGRRTRTRRSYPLNHAPQPAEILEQRSLLSASAVFVEATGELSLELGSSESALVSSVNGNVLISLSNDGSPFVPFTGIGTLPTSGIVSLNVYGGDDANTIDLSNVTLATYPNLTSIQAFGDDGHDLLIGSPNLANQLFGEDGNDSLTGGLADDTLNGGNGNDTIVGNEGNDSIAAGDGTDSVVAGDGNDTISGGNGNDTVSAGNGDDSVAGQNGQDVLLGDAGNDTLNGDGGFDTLSGGDGNDSMLGGEFSDSLLGDAGDDTLLGNSGDDTVIGVTGFDIADGGAGNDLIRSALEIAVDDAIPAAATPAPTTLTLAPLPDAVDSTLGVNTNAQTTTIGSGTGDGSLTVQVTSTGAFGIGSFPTITSAGAPYDPIGGVSALDTTFDSEIFFRDNTLTGARTSIDSLATNRTTIRGTSSEANSSFDIGSLHFVLTQTAEPVIDAATSQRVGSLLTQTYRITNTSAATANFELARYLDGRLQFDTSVTDGGGRFVSTAGDEFLIETDAGGISAATSFVGITGKGGTIPSSNRFQIDQSLALQTALQAGQALNGQVFRDTNADQSTDTNYDVSLGLRNTFSLVGQASATYTTHTLFGTGTPNQIQLNQNPVAVGDAGRVTAGRDVAINVVANDFDRDGSLIFSAIQVSQQPTFGTAVPLPDGRIRYTPNAGFSGTDTYSYTIVDNLGASSLPASVTMFVSAVDTVGDSLNAGVGNDTAIGSEGDDTILGGAGHDSLSGGLGNDRIVGQGGDDTLNGGGDADNLIGGADNLNGGDGQDVLQSLALKPLVNNVSITEGDFGTSVVTFTINLSETSLASVVYQFQTVDGTAIAGQDYLPVSGLLTFAAGETQKTVNVVVLGDVLGEASEFFSLRLVPVANSLLESAEAIATIANDDVTVSISDATAPEGSTGSTTTMQFTVSLSIPSTVAVIVDFNLTDDDASAATSSVTIVAPPSVFTIDQDYVATTGRVVILPGAMTATISVTVLGDAQSEDSERLFVNLIAASNATILDSQANGIIQNDDGGGPFLHPITDENFITLSNRWTTTATNGSGLVQGDATTLTFGIVPDGTPVPDLNGALAPSNLIARLDAIYNETNTGPNVTNRTWFALVQSIFDRYSSFSGMTYVFEPNDDGAAVDEPFMPIVSPGILGVRPDVRIGGRTLDGNGGVLGFNGFPENGDMVLDTNDNTYLNLANNSRIFRNILAHEHGHGLGLRHVVPITQSIMMEPFPATNFDGPQEDDILATNRGYGDRLEKNGGNDTTSAATALGTLAPSNGPAASQFQISQVSIDDDSDSDFYQFTLTEFANVTVTVNPTGTKYLSGVQFPPIFSPFNARAQSDLAFDLIAADGTTVLNTMSGVGFGLTESQTLTSLAAGTYFIRVTGSENLAQMYDLSVVGTILTDITVVGAVDEGDAHAGGEGNDFVIAGSGNDTINGQGGNDSLFGNTGNDQILGGSGNDTLVGGRGNDTLDGQGHDDSLLGGAGDDIFVLGNGSGGDDVVDGGEGFNQIQVHGTGASDNLTIGANNRRITATRGLATITADNNMSVQRLVVNAGFGEDTVTVNDLSTIDCAILVIVNGDEGNDRLTAQGSRLGLARLMMNGNAGNDTIIGSLDGDSLSGNDGDDAINGLAGNDSILGGAGADIVAGGLGDDTLDGGDGADFVTGNAGNDRMRGGADNDTLRGFEGDDTLDGQAGDDNLNGMDGNDVIRGGVGKDQLVGGSGNDSLDGGRNDDSINGNTGDDSIVGDHGNDFISAGDGNNTVYGGDGNDTILSEGGDDIVVAGDGDDVVSTDGGNDVILGGDGSDSIQAGGGNDTILGGDGDDVLNGQGGSDVVAGQQGIDVIADPFSEIVEAFSLTNLSSALLKILGGPAPFPT